MVKMKIQKNKKMISILIVILMIIGGVVMFQLNKQSEEVRRNREYEVSLVKALKNSYEGIEEIKISDPSYIAIPGSWSCDVEIIFNDGQEISYGINHDLSKKTNYDGRQKTDDDWKYLQNHRGQTMKIVKVLYSDQTEGKQ